MKYFKNNVPQCQIAKDLQISSSTVHNIIKSFRETSLHKGQGLRPLLDTRGLRALRWHCITHRHDSVIDITKWTQVYFQKPLSVNTIRCAICRCQLKLYHAKRKPYVNIIQKRHRVLWAKAHWGRPSSVLSAFSLKASISDGMGVHKCIQYGQLAYFGRHYECWKVY